MTNVPEKIREAWADVYRLFDVSYAMEGSEEEWKQYWDRATELVKKYGDEIPLLEIFEATAHMIEAFIKQRSESSKKESEILFWGKDEDYPYPKLGSEN